MANANNFLSAGSLTKPPTLIREEYPQWKIRMIHFFEHTDKNLVQYLYNSPPVPMIITPRVPGTALIEEVPEQRRPKPRDEWSTEDVEAHEVTEKTKRILIMAIPNEIFQSLDACETAYDLWKELERQLEGGAKTQKNRRAQYINEYHAFRASATESLQTTYDRFNSLINKCKKAGIHRTSEENNVMFLKSLNDEWLQLSMSLQTNQDLDTWTLSDLYGSLAAQEPQIAQAKSLTIAPYALVSKSTEATERPRKEKATEEKKEKKKMVMMVDSEEDEQTEETTLASLAKSLALLTREFRGNQRYTGNDRYGRDNRENRRDDGRREGSRDRQKSDDRSDSQRSDYRNNDLQKSNDRAYRGNDQQKSDDKVNRTTTTTTTDHQP